MSEIFTISNNIIPQSEVASYDSDENKATIILKDGSAWVSETELAEWCEVADVAVISTLLKNTPDKLESLLSGTFCTLLKIENPKSPNPYVCFSAKDAGKILQYYAHVARGHRNRSKAKQRLSALLDAGATAYIYSKNGYSMQKKDQASVQQPEDQLDKNISRARQVADIFKIARETGMPLSQTQMQLMSDMTSNLLLAGQQKLLDGTDDDKPNWKGVVELAQEMGYKNADDRTTRVKLGQFVARNISEKTVSSFDERYVEGQKRPVRAYDIRDTHTNKEVRALIEQFFSLNLC
ncbi:MAG: hypothetical protein AAFW70_12010 [Cyanobacteria bacterium J06635_10]